MKDGIKGAKDRAYNAAVKLSDVPEEDFEVFAQMLKDGFTQDDNGADPLDLLISDIKRKVKSKK